MSAIARVLIAMSLVLSTAHAAAATVDAFVFGFSPRTGDAFLDAELGDMNVLVRGGTDGFVDDVVVRFGAPRTIVRSYVVERRWAPADVYYACAIAQQIRRPCVEVIRVYERDHRLGWGAVARRLGIRPGSPAFHALKGNVGRGHAKFRHEHGRRLQNRRDHDAGRGNAGQRDAGHGNAEHGSQHERNDEPHGHGHTGHRNDGKHGRGR